LPKDAGTSRGALSKEKQQGWNRFVLHRASANRDAARRKTLAAGDAIMRAIKDSRLTFAVQPIVNGVTGETKLYESLLSMLDENGDLFLAALFIPVVEQLGLTRHLNKYTLELAFLEMEGVKRINLAVNISGASEAGSTTPDHLLSLVQMHSGVADWLIFEIRETVAMMDFEEPAGFANKRPELGCRISLDDFGASYASCQHLKNLAADIMKFDGQFAKGPLENKGN
jgi:EAL domain-containing protein (putative c-di-GMP-specific phosphodiesterase class I)